MTLVIMTDLKSYLETRRLKIDDALVKLINKSDCSTSIIEAMMHSLMAGGKRLRPILCMAAADSVGGNGEKIINAGCAIEMIHTYSLIHDDLPAMDNDDLRRGLPTCHKAFDEATAILAGDALNTLAFQVLSSQPTNDHNQALKLLSATHIIANAAGYRGMIDGQMLDIGSEGKKLSFAELEKMHLLKTGALIQASVCTGAILGGGNNVQIKNLEIYSKKIGLAFQVADDILNVEGDPEIMGKAVGTDQNRHKSTYPSILGIKQSKDLALNLINEALFALNSFDETAEPLRTIALYIIERKR